MEAKKGGNPGYDCVLGDLHRKQLGSYSELYVTILGLKHEIAICVTCHKMSQNVTYFAYFRKFGWQDVDEIALILMGM